MSFRPRKALISPLFFILMISMLAACVVQPAPATPTSTATIAATATITPTFTAVLPTATATTPACQETSGSIGVESVPGKVSKQPTEVRIYLPPCYDPSGSVRYPVLYMLHGQTYDDTQWQNLGLTTAADLLIAARQIAPLIIVMPNEADSMSDADTSTFGEALTEEIIPWVDEDFATCAERTCRAIGGLSRGGNWAVRIGLSHPDLFAVIGAHSAPLFYGDLNRIPGWISAIPAGETPPMIYIDFGKSDEEKDDMLQFDQQLNRLGAPHQMLQFDGFHDADYWSGHVTDYLLWYSSVIDGAH